MAARKRAVGIWVGGIDDLLQRTRDTDISRYPVRPGRGADAGHVVADIEGRGREIAGRIERADIRRGNRLSIVSRNHGRRHREALHPIRDARVRRRYREVRQIARHHETRSVGRAQTGLVGVRIVVRIAGVERIDGRVGALVTLEGPLRRLGRGVGPNRIVDERNGGGERRRRAVAERGRAGAGAVQEVDVARIVRERRRGVRGRRETLRRRARCRGPGSRQIVGRQDSQPVQNTVGLRGPVVVNGLQGLRIGAVLSHRDDGLIVLRHHGRIAEHQRRIAIQQLGNHRPWIGRRAVGEIHRRRSRNLLSQRRHRHEKGPRQQQRNRKTHRPSHKRTRTEISGTKCALEKPYCGRVTIWLFDINITGVAQAALSRWTRSRRAGAMPTKPASRSSRQPRGRGEEVSASSFSHLICFFVMAGLAPSDLAEPSRRYIHVLTASRQERRGCPAQGRA